MKFVVTADQMKVAEDNAVLAGISLQQLMENAGIACYQKIDEIIGGCNDKTFVVLCGRGNNGGDGIVIAQQIKQAGGEVLCIFASDLPNTQCARDMYSKYGQDLDTAIFTHREDVVKTALENCDVIVDCVFGTGFHGTLEPKTAVLFRFINNNCRAIKFSVDAPSGIDVTTGEVSEGAFRPNVTLALGAVKTGMFAKTCFNVCGSLVLVDIGIPENCYPEYIATITENDIMRYIPKRPFLSHKGNFGRLFIVAGSERYIGAALLCTKAALKTGVGRAMLAAPREVCRSIAPAVPEAVYCPLYADDKGYFDDVAVETIKDDMANATAIAIGSGIGRTHDTKEVTEFVIKNARCPIILDADGINSIVGNINILKDNDKLKILTPHPAEFARLTGLSVDEIENDRLKYASHYAREWNILLVLKGANTVIAAPDGQMSVNPTGNPGLAKAGAGDVLTGMIASFVAQGVSGFDAARLAVYLHGLAADRLAESVSLAGIMPSDIADYLPFVMKS